MSSPHRAIESNDPGPSTEPRSWLGRGIVRVFGAVAHWINTRTALVLGLLVSAGLLVGTSVAAGEIYEAIAERDGVAVLDRPLLRWLLTVRNPTLDRVIADFSNSGGPFWMPIVTTVVTVVLCLVWRRWTPLLLMLIAVAGSLAITIVGKRLSGRARPALSDAVPPPETSASFPSGHALNSIVIAGLICYLVLSHLRSALARAAAVTIAATYVLAMGLSRVYLGHHWLTDVLAAWAFGIGWLTVVITGHRLWQHQHRAAAGSGNSMVE